MKINSVTKSHLPARALRGAAPSLTMFQIIDFHHVNGKLRTTIEADDQFFGMFVRFIRMAQKFCILLDYKLKKEKEIKDFSKTGPLRKKRAARARARMLSEFRKIPGTRSH